jgi:O-antigen/teichoic acid export membrane protein
MTLGQMRLAFAVLRAVRVFEWEAALPALQKGLALGLAAAALLAGAGAAGVAAAFSLSYALTCLLALHRAGREVRRAPARGAERGPSIRFLLGTCAPLFLIELLTNLYFRLDQVLLLRLRGAEETGIYAAAYRVLEALLLMVAGAMTVLFPRLAAAARREAGRFRADFVRAWNGLWLAGLLLAINGSLWGAGLLPALLGRAYAPSEAPLRILLPALPLLYVNYLLTQSLIARGREGFYAAGAGACAVLNLGLNLLLIPPLGARGAAYATLATEGALLVICLHGLGEMARAVPARLTFVTGIAAAAIVPAGLALEAQILWRVLLASVLSVGMWEIFSPWPLRRSCRRAPPR